jgi:hypothetical protein
MKQITPGYISIKRVHQVGHYPESHQDARSTKHKIQNLFRHKTLNVSGIFCAHHQELPAVCTGIGTFHSGYVAAS